MKYKIILSSNSPRRKELLAGLDLDYEVRVVDGIDESYPHDLSASEIPVYISKKKVRGDLVEEKGINRALSLRNIYLFHIQFLSLYH